MQHVTYHFEDKSFKAINWIGTDNQAHNNTKCTQHTESYSKKNLD